MIGHITKGKGIRYKIKGLYTLFFRFFIFNIAECKISEFVMKYIRFLNYKDLNNLRYILSMDNYEKVVKQVVENNLKCWSEKGKVTISFILYDASMWCGDDLYYLFKNDDRFKVNVLLFRRNDNKSESDDKNFLIGLSKLRKKGVDVVPVYNENDAEVDISDVLFYLTPYDGVLTNKFRIKHLGLNHLICYIHYGFSTNDIDIDYYIRYVVWREFIGDKAYQKELESNIKRSNDYMKYTGYPKLDWIYKNKKYVSMTSRKKTIIWAPHWSIEEGILYATFQHNFKFFLEYAKNNEDIRWIVKPHPNLFFSAVRSGVFSTDQEFNSYIEAWKALPNAEVVVGGDYQESFCESDAMILDSSSFVAEYQYVNKPMLFLRRETQTFNKLADDIIKASYSVNGDDYSGIEKFIDDVVMHGNDYKSEQREKLFKQKLDYYDDNKMLASETIYRCIKEEIFN